VSIECKKIRVSIRRLTL